MMLKNFIVDKSIIMVVSQLRKDVIIVLEKFEVEILSQFEVFEEDSPIVVEMDL